MMTADEAVAIGREEFAKKHNLFPCPSCGALSDEKGNIVISQDRHERDIDERNRLRLLNAELIDALKQALFIAREPEEFPSMQIRESEILKWKRQAALIITKTEGK